MKLEWLAEALADLDRFALFLHEHHPNLAAIAAAEIMEKARLLSERPLLGRPVAGREEYRQIVRLNPWQRCESRRYPFSLGFFPLTHSTFSG